MSRILIAEDSDSLRDVLQTVLVHSGFVVQAVSDAESALEALRLSQFDCILSDFKLPKMNGLQLLEAAREITRTTPFILMTAYGSIDIAVKAMKSGANDFISKPFEPGILCALLNQVVEHKRIIDRNIGVRGRRERTFITRDPEVEKLLGEARKVARVDTSALILGESGTGKELIAGYMHDHSPRAPEIFIGVNCAALPPELLESEFFGHEAGSFTGATQSRPGVFELATNGTLFLDEIGDMPAALQVKLLRALQEREIKRVGGTKTIKVTPRIIAATNRNIEIALADGTLREDLFYRIAVVTLSLPPLRERRADIMLLAEYYREYFCNQLGRPGLEFGAAAKKMISDYHWPGNARELENVVERAVILAEREIAPEQLGIHLSLNLNSIDSATISLHQIAQHAAREAEIEVIRHMLAQTQGNKSRAARMLGVSYKTLLSKVREYALEIGTTTH